MRSNLRNPIIALLILSLIGAACGSRGGTPEVDRVATRVAEELSVGATLTAAAPTPAQVNQPQQAPSPTATSAAAVEASPTAAVVNSPTAPPADANNTAPLNTATKPPANNPPPPSKEEAAIIPAGGEDNGLKGEVLVPGLTGVLPKKPTFKGGVTFRMRVVDLNVGSEDGAGIESVDFTINDPDGNPVLENEEVKAPYCAFGGNNPQCPGWVFDQHGDRWPSGDPVIGGTYTVNINVNAENQNRSGANWNFQFILDHPGNTTSTSEPVVSIVFPPPGTVATDQLYFQVEAFDPSVGTDDGDGIDHVEMYLLDANGNTIHHKNEVNAHYCLFSGGEPDCNRWVFADNGNLWPNGTPIVSGTYWLVAVAYTDNGASARVETTVEIQIQ